MKWIKASERLPEINGRYYVKTERPDLSKKIGKGVSDFHSTPIYAGENWVMDNVTLWLDESPSIPLLVAEEIWVEYIKKADGPPDKPVVDSKMVISAMQTHSAQYIIECERLAALVETAYRSAHNLAEGYGQYQDDDWNKFKLNHNIK